MQLSWEAALNVAVPFFRRLGAIAEGHGVVACLEPNPARYGANFMVDSRETAEVVRAVAHPAIRMQLDVGALAINGDNAADVLRADADLIGHVHASEPGLVPLGDGGADHASAAAALAAILPGHVVAIEMLANGSEPHLQAIERAVGVAIRHYRKN
jgi:sugar phosphate isomerase/epimerase